MGLAVDKVVGPKSKKKKITLFAMTLDSMEEKDHTQKPLSHESLAWYGQTSAEPWARAVQ